MKQTSGLHSIPFNVAGVLIAIGIIYGDIGTSPLYVFNAIVGDKVISEGLILGALSCVFWTLTLQTTFKYVLLTLTADNNGEGGMFSLYALIKRRTKYMLIPAIVGGAALLAEGIITPPISVSSAVEGLESRIPNMPTVTVVVIILSLLFIIQQFGTRTVGKWFAPVMVIWFSMIAILGAGEILHNLSIFKAIHPAYALNLLTNYPKGFYLLGAVFLCTTGAEALYSDLGHCGRKNIRISWIFVKTCLILNYFGQGAWLIAHKGEMLGDKRVFFELMPPGFLYIGVAIATMAAIVASQAMITGSFTLISEAIRLGFWPKMRVVYTTEKKGHIFVPAINFLLWMGCMFIVYYFRESANMEAAYGLAINTAMPMTTLLFAAYLRTRLKQKPIWVILYLSIFLTLEGAFYVANLEKFSQGGYITVLITLCIIAIMFIWYRARQIRNQMVEFVELEPFVPMLEDLSKDLSIPKYATNLVFLTSSESPNRIEKKIIYSIFENNPKRADIYWMVHINVHDDPYTCEYSVNQIIPNDIIRVDFKLGFRVDQKINILLRKVIEDLIESKELEVENKYATKYSFMGGDFRYVMIKKEFSYENEMEFFDKLLVFGHSVIKRVGISEEKSFGLDSALVKTESYPLLFNRKLKEFPLKRNQKKH
ncbi:MAG: KUP/HAK/KT family potassium transporter [Flavobacteriales bacterium]|nr:KUP/HAK/KT family potassium transporter [Flavobacteriales bacterium]